MPVLYEPWHTQDLELRLQTIFESITDIIKLNKPNIMVVRSFFCQNATTAMSVSHARGVILLAGVQAGVAIAEYTPLQIKQALTGYGQADKIKYKNG